MKLLGEYARSIIDIAVDLKGYTTNARPTVFLLKPAPIQVCYLGYPGTSAARYMNYILADETVIPPHKASVLYRKYRMVARNVPSQRSHSLHS